MCRRRAERPEVFVVWDAAKPEVQRDERGWPVGWFEAAEAPNVARHRVVMVIFSSSDR